MIYFLRHKETGLIKIGTTKDLSARLAFLTIQHGALELLGLHDGYETEEQALHIKFCSLNQRGILFGREWFRADKPLLEYIRANTSLNIPLSLASRDRKIKVGMRVTQSPLANRSGFVNKLPELVSAYQLKHGVTIKELAKAIGIHHLTLSRYTKSQMGSVEFEAWQKLADFFQVDGGEIFDMLPDLEDEST